MELRQLRYLRAVARSGSFTAAAASAGVAQPAISKQILLLERELGAPLFDRGSRGAILTDIGAVVVRYAERVADTLEDLETEVADRQTLARGRLRLCASETIMDYLLPPVLMALLRRHPGLEVSAEMLGSDDAVALLLDREIDIAIVTLPLTHADIAVTPLFTEEIVLLVPAADPFASRSSVALTEIADRPLLLSMTGHGLRAVVDAACRRMGFSAKPALELRSQEALIRLVEQGAGLAFAPRLCVRQPRPGVHVCALSQPTLRRAIGWAVLRDRHTPTPVRAFVRELEAGTAAIT